MGIIYNLTVRNMKVYLRNKSSVFFSFLSILIIIALYAVFLGDTNVRQIQASVGNVEGIRFMVDSWIMAGIIIVSTITVTLGVFGIMVEDENKKRLNGFLVTPISRAKLVAGYVISSWIIGFIITVASFFLGEAYIVAMGGELLSIEKILKAIGVIALCEFSSTSMVFFIVTFIKNNTSFSTVSSLIGTMIGFVTGIYLPLGILPEAVQTFIKFVPASHGAALMRQIFMERPLDMVFANAPQSVKLDFMDTFGVRLIAGDTEISQMAMLAILFFSGVLFSILSIYKLSIKKAK